MSCWSVNNRYTNLFEEKGMQPSSNNYLHALAFLYDNINDFPTWLRRLSPGQMEQIAAIMKSWESRLHSGNEILPLEEVEKQALTRAVSLCDGDVPAAAKALRIGKTTLYRRLKHWGYSPESRRLVLQASVLARLPHARNVSVSKPLLPQSAAVQEKSGDEGRPLRRAH